MTTKNESQANIQSFLAAGGTPDILKKEKYGGKLSSGELQTFLTKYGLKSPAQQAYSADNIAAASTAPAPRPDDLMNIRSQIYNELGIPQLQTEYQNLYKQLSDYNTAALQKLNTYDTETEQGQQGIMNQPKAMGVLRGEAAQQADQRALERSALAREVETASTTLANQLDVLKNKLSMSTTEADERYNLRANEVNDVKQLMLQFPDAGIGFGDSTETMAEKIRKSNEKKVVTDMFTQTFGYFPEGLSMDAMNKKLAKKYKSEKAYAAAKQALELQNIQSTIAAREQSANQEEIARAQKESEEAAKKAEAEVNARSKFLDNIVQTYIVKVGKERRQSKKDALKEEARRRIEAQYPGWGWVAEKIG